MKRFICILLLVFLLCGCQAEPQGTSVPPLTVSPGIPTTVAPTTEPATEPTTAPTTEPATEPPTEPTVSDYVPPTEPDVVLYRNPLNGTPMDKPYTGRIFASTISNQKDALPHRGVNQADLYFEMLVNGGMTRGLAFFSDVKQVESVGPIRSCRYQFVDLCKSYNAVLVYGGGYQPVLDYLNASGISKLSALQSEVAYRDLDRNNSGYAWEHCLYANGEKLMNVAQKRGIQVTQDPGRDYGLLFQADGTPENGATANKIIIDFWGMSSVLDYDRISGKYLHTNYDIPLIDEATGEREGFRNVIIIHTGLENDELGYHFYDIEGSGKGFFACGGKLIPITWKRSSERKPFTFFLEDGTPLELGVGNTYVAIAPTGRDVVYE